MNHLPTDNLNQRLDSSSALEAPPLIFLRAKALTERRVKVVNISLMNCFSTENEANQSIERFQ